MKLLSVVPLLLAIVASVLVGCTAPPPPASPTAEMPNPASKYCVEQGGKVEIRTTEGGEVGYCVFPDGSECEEWAFFRGECKPEVPVIGMPNPASKYCVEQGGKVEIRTTEGGEVGYCVFPDGSECEEWAFFRGECAPGGSGPTATPAAEAKPSRIEFEPGATSTTIQGQIAAHGTDEYLLRAQEGQLMIVVITSPNNDVYLNITGVSDGTPLVRAVSEANSWTGILPATQDYAIQAVAAGDSTPYDLSITIPIWIRLSPGSDSTVVQGKARVHQIVDYVLYGQEGQTMDITVTSPNNDALLSVTALEDGIPLLRVVAEATQWSGVLPGTEHYLIRVFASGDTTYTLEVTIK